MIILCHEFFFIWDVKQLIKKPFLSESILRVCASLAAIILPPEMHSQVSSDASLPNIGSLSAHSSSLCH